MPCMCATLVAVINQAGVPSRALSLHASQTHAMQTMLLSRLAAGRLVYTLGSQFPAACSPAAGNTLTRRHGSSATERSAAASPCRWLQDGAQPSDSCRPSWLLPSKSSSSHAAHADTHNSSGSSGLPTHANDPLRKCWAASATTPWRRQQAPDQGVPTTPKHLQGTRHPISAENNTQLQPQAAPPAVTSSAAGVTGLVPPGVTTLSWPGHGVFFFWQLGEWCAEPQHCYCVCITLYYLPPLI
jgi:hypothetical protein